MTTTRQDAAPRNFLLLTIFAGLALSILIGLGTWQVQRMSWKEALIADIERQMQAEPVALPVVLDDPAVWEFRRVSLTGRFHHDKERHVYRPGPKGGAGYHVFTPFERRSGGFIMVNRGWVAESVKAQELREEGQVRGDVTVTGVLRQKEIPPSFSARILGEAEQNIFYLAWPKELAATVGIDVPDYYVAADDSANPGGWPIGGVTRVDLPNNHLQYALTWYGLAAALIGVYAVLAYNRRQNKG